MNSNKIKRRVSLLLTFLLMITLLALPVAASEERPVLNVGGGAFGVRFFTDGVLVVSFCDVQTENGACNPAREAGLRPGDCIYKINEETTESATAVAEAIERCGEAPLTLHFRREGQERQVTLAPVRCREDGRFRTGLYVRDSGAGLGTVTFVTKDGTFGGLGHGICDGESGTLIPLSRGSVMGVTVTGIKRGAAGAPGELKGHFSNGKCGALTQNTPCGVFGVMSEAQAATAGELPIAYASEVHDGAVTLWCTLDENEPREYTAEISGIHRGAKGNKCFTVHVTDKTLIEKTGGIVQGMSGSPLVQDGRLIGAVTHVLIGDPTTGYGIFIENMLENMAVALK